MKFTRQSIQFLFVFSFVCTSLLTQKLNAQSALPNKAFEFAGGYSRHGSGDMHGISFGTGYITYLSDKFSLNYNMRAHINSSQTYIIVNDAVSQTTTDASVRFTTAGVQLGVNAGLSLVRNSHHEIMLSLGAFGRYQSASNGSDGYSLYYPATTGMPTVLVGYDNHTNQHTIALGGILQFHYNYTFRNNIYLGIQPGVQTDTNGDVILQAALTIGKRL
jgi:hypothetical protein